MDNFNFKEVAEKCLSGELSGLLIIEHELEGSYKVPSKNLILNRKDPDHIYEYLIKTDGVKGAEDMTTYFAEFSTTGKSKLGYYRVVDFIPDNMKQEERSVKLTLDKAKEWYRQGGGLKEVALQVFTEEELTKLDRPKSWEEYCENFKGQYYYIQDNRDNIATSFTPNGLISSYKNYVPSEELAEAFLAMMQLMSLRQSWIRDWEPDWCDYNTKYCIYSRYKHAVIGGFQDNTQPLSFPTREMAQEFLDCFKELLEKAEGLY